MERLQEAIASHINAEVEQMDLSVVWNGIAPRLGSASPTWQHLWEEWWDSIREGWRTWGPVTAAVAAVGLLAILFWPGSGPTPEQVAGGDRDSGVIVESVRSSVGSVALVNEPTTDTMLMWITDEGPVTVDDLGDLP